MLFYNSSLRQLADRTIIAMNNSLDKIISITELRRNFGSITERLPYIDELILTKGGEPFAILKAAPSEKRKIFKKAAGSWKNTELDNPKIIKEMLKRKSRNKPIVF